MHKYVLKEEKKSTIHTRYFSINEFLLKQNTVRSTFAVYLPTDRLVLNNLLERMYPYTTTCVFFNFSSTLIPFHQLEFEQWRRPILKTKTKCYP